MTRAREEDLRLTLEVLEGKRPPINDDTTTWLGHATEPDKPQGRKTDGQCGQIDLALLEGRFTLSEIAHRVSEVTGKACTEKRVEDHLDHLQETGSGGGEPHHLKLKEEDGKWSFDKEWIRQRVLLGTVVRYDQPTAPVAESDWAALQ